MYIEPNSTIQLMKNVPLNNRQTDTYFFGTRTLQTNFFAQFVPTGYTFQKQSYQRVNREYCKLKINPELVHECNYMRFQNTAFGDKWFYGFILDSDYINNNTVIIHYKIDPLQSWFFEYSNNMKQCFVEREHTATDVIGENLQDEPVLLGEYYTLSRTKANVLDKMAIVTALGWYELPSEDEEE